MMKTESSDKTKSKREERRIFRYTLADAWKDIISQVEVLDGIEDKNIRCLYFDRPRSLTHEGNTKVDSFFTTISQKDITAYNIWAFRGNVDVGIIGTPPYKGGAVLQLFDEISKILLDNGVDPKYLRTD